MKKQFEKAHPGKKVELVPIQAPENDYYTKLQQMMRSPKTAPDLVYEDTFLINSDITAGYLRPLDDYLAKWATGASSPTPPRRRPRRRTARRTASRTAPTPAGSGSTRRSSRKAGLPADWQPKTWDDILTAARTIKKKVPGVIPLNVYTGKAAGEAAAMQGFEMLLYGTGDGEPAVRPGVEEVGRRAARASRTR